VNREFAEYTSSVAFALHLTKLQCNALLALREHKAKPGHSQFPLHTVDTMRSLERRGLVSWSRDAAGRACKFDGLTRAGRIMVLLLKEAGMSVENTATLSVLRRMDRYGERQAA
jgi:hypothetical protein